MCGMNTFQKQQQMDLESHIMLHDVACLWVWLLPKLSSTFPGEVVDRHIELFFKGFLGLGVLRVAVPACLGGSCPAPNNNLGL